MTIFVRAYLRASTSEQDAQRARDMLDHFAHEHKITICNHYAENESDARLDRPELFRLLKDCQRGDVLLIEDVDRLSRLIGDDWNTLKKMIGRKDVRIVAVNVPTTWLHLSPALADFDNRMFGAINDMLLDMLAAVARRDYEQRRERQKQGIAKAREEGKYRGRRVNQHRHDAINCLLASGSSWSQVQKTIGCSRGTISRAIRLAGLVTTCSDLHLKSGRPAFTLGFQPRLTATESGHRLTLAENEPAFTQSRLRLAGRQPTIPATKIAAEGFHKTFVFWMLCQSVSVIDGRWRAEYS